MRTLTSALSGNKTMLILSVAAWLPAVGAQQDSGPQKMRDLVEQALDQNVKQIAIRETPLLEALDELDKQTGVSFKLGRETVDLMPYGERTRVSLQLENTPLRAGLRQMFDRLALTMRVDGEHVVVEPAPVLSRIGRRISINELGVIEKLASDPWSALRGKISIQLRVDPALHPAELLDRAIAQSGNGSAADQLEAATESLGWVWFPQDQQIAVCPKPDYFRQRLDQPVDLNYQRLPLEDVLIDLGRKSGVPMLFEPGSLACSTTRSRFIDLIHRRTTVHQSLELLCGRTGLRYEVTDGGVQLSTLAGKSTSARSLVGPMSVRISVPLGIDGATVDFVIPEDQLPPELQSLRQEKLEELLRIMKERRTAGTP